MAPIKSSFESEAGVPRCDADVTAVEADAAEAAPAATALLFV